MSGDKIGIYSVLTALVMLLAPDYSRATSEVDFAVWKELLKREAIVEKLDSPMVLQAIDSIALNQEALRLDAAQPEKRPSYFKKYLAASITPALVKRARDEYRDNLPLLQTFEKKYGVPGRFIIALWAKESSFGENTGDFAVLDTLATLAFDGRRSQLFKSELFAALKMLHQDMANESQLTGSWAGAMGQCQFMPSAFLKYAADGDGDGKIDIWLSRADALASIASYLSNEGWSGNTWGYAVILPKNFKLSQTGRENKHPATHWSKLGVGMKNQAPLPAIADSAIIAIDQNPNQAYMVNSNYDIIMKWNRSLYFATTIGLLADSIH